MSNAAPTLNGINRRDALLLGAALVLSCPVAAAAAVQDESWLDTARGRELPVRLRWPATPGPWPWLVFSHGLGGSREGADVWGQAWREAGFAVLHVQHPGSDAEVIRSGGLRSLRAAGNAQQLIARAADLRFVLDEAARRQRGGDQAWQRVRLDAIGVSGHSFGALTTLAVAGQRYSAPGDLSDPRPRAFIAFSPASTRAHLSVQEQFGGITRPFMAVTGSLDGDPFGSFDTGEPRAQVYEGLPAGQRALLWLDGADHMTFGGNRERRTNGARRADRAAVARAREDAHHAALARLTTLWWRWRLQGEVAARDALAAPSGLSVGDRLMLG